MKKKDFYKICENQNRCTFSVKQECSEWSLVLSIDIFTDNNFVFDKFYNEVKNSRYRKSSDYNFTIFGDWNKMFEPLYDVSFYRYSNGKGGSLNFYYLVGH